MTETADSTDSVAAAAAAKPFTAVYDPRLANDDLIPLKKQSWSSYNIFAFWMSDVHSVGGYVTAGSLFALGLSSWQVLISLLIGIVIVNIFCNLVAKPSQAAGVPYPVMCRSAFGVLGANMPAIIRGLIAVAWYGIQTYLASAALDVVLLKLFGGLAPYADVEQYGFLGLPLMGWGTYALLWVLQACVFLDRHGDNPQVHRLLWSRCVRRDVRPLRVSALPVGLAFRLRPRRTEDRQHRGRDARCDRPRGVVLLRPDAEFRRLLALRQDFRRRKTGNFLGLPINFLMFSLLVVITAAATVPVFGELITDPVETVARIDNTLAIVLGALTFTIATIGINIVANFISPAPTSVRNGSAGVPAG